MVMDKYQPFTPKYVYKGLTLRQYCLKNDLSYYSIVSFVKRKLAKNSKKTIDELINEGINIINRYGIVYYYKGIPLKDYAKDNLVLISTHLLEEAEALKSRVLLLSEGKIRLDAPVERLRSCSADGTLADAFARLTAGAEENAADERKGKIC